MKKRQAEKERRNRRGRCGDSKARGRDFGQERRRGELSGRLSGI